MIDGFTRSAVTFAVVGFQVAQDDHVRVSHHLHAVAHIVAAVRQGVPVLVPVRPPSETIASAVVREPLVPLREFLKSYIVFYRRILPVRSSCVVAPFEDVTGDLGSIVGRVNDRFGTNFRRFEHSEANVATVFELIDERARRPPWDPMVGQLLSGRISLSEYQTSTMPLRKSTPLPDIPEHRVQRPSDARRTQREAVRIRYEAPALADLRSRAEAAYEAFIG